MSWRAASGREQCNRCRAEIQMAASVWIGPMTGVAYCGLCALELFGKREGEPDEAVGEHAPLTAADEALSQGFEALRRKADRGLRVVERDWTGER